MRSRRTPTPKDPKLVRMGEKSDRLHARVFEVLRESTDLPPEVKTVFDAYTRALDTEIEYELSLAPDDATS